MGKGGFFLPDRILFKILASARCCYKLSNFAKAEMPLVLEEKKYERFFFLEKGICKSSDKGGLARGARISSRIGLYWGGERCLEDFCIIQLFEHCF